MSAFGGKADSDTLKNVRETGEFCFNVVTEAVWREMVDSANAFPIGYSEFTEAGLTPIPSVKIAAPRVKGVSDLGTIPSSKMISAQAGSGSTVPNHAVSQYR